MSGNSSRVQAKFDEVSSEYSKLYYDGGAILSFEKQRRMELLLDEVARLKPERVLDAGCGPGIVIANLSERLGMSCYGVDLSFSMLKAAKSSIQAAGSCAIAQAKVEQLPFIPCAFDLVYALGLLDYLNEPESFFRVVGSVLKPGGYFIFTYPNKDSLFRTLRDYLSAVKNRHSVRVKSTPLSSHRVDQLVANSGFSLLKRQYITYGLGFVTFPWSSCLSKQLEKLIACDSMNRRLAWTGYCLTQKKV